MTTKEDLLASDSNVASPLATLGSSFGNTDEQDIKVKESLEWLAARRVEGFIEKIRESFVGAETVYTTGSCYRLYKILEFVFPQANAYYNSDHVITEINGRYYDITGEVEKTNHLLMSEHYPNSSVAENKCDALKLVSEVQSVLEEHLSLTKKTYMQIKFGDLFIHIPTNSLHQCVGNDEGLVWYIPQGQMESKSFDPGDCSKNPSDLFPQPKNINNENLSK